MNHFRLLPGLRCRRLRSDVVQLGADPQRAVAVRLPDARYAELIDHIGEGVDAAALDRLARRLGLPSQAATELVRMLRDAGFLTETPARRGGPRWRQALFGEECAVALRRRDPQAVLADRARQRVFLDGQGWFAERLKQVLRDAGVGRVWSFGDGVRDRATFTVLLGAVPEVMAARAHARRGRPHLAVRQADGQVHIGPLVRPGHTMCLRCVELTRAVPSATTSSGNVRQLESALAELAVSIVASAVLQYSEGDLSTLNGSGLVLRPPMEMDREAFSAHPECDCGFGVVTA